MPCIPIPLPAVPTLPEPLRITAETPPIDVNGPNFCCKLPQFKASLPPQKLPTTIINSGVLAALNQAFAKVQAFLDALPLDCPKE